MRNLDLDVPHVPGTIVVTMECKHLYDVKYRVIIDPAFRVAKGDRLYDESHN